MHQNLRGHQVGYQSWYSQSFFKNSNTQCWAVLIGWPGSQSGSQSCCDFGWKLGWKSVLRFSPMWEPAWRIGIDFFLKERAGWVFTWKLESGSQGLKTNLVIGSSYSSHMGAIWLLMFFLLGATLLLLLLLFSSYFYYSCLYYYYIPIALILFLWWSNYISNYLIIKKN